MEVSMGHTLGGYCREALQPDTLEVYLETGRTGYRDHYLHLWSDGDPTPYLSGNFTEAQVRKDLADPKAFPWLIRHNGHPAGICKWVLERPGCPMPGKRGLFIEKIYFKKAFTGQGMGGRLMQDVLAWARDHQLDFLWLEAMQKGPALNFYEQWGFQRMGETQVPYRQVRPEERPMWIMGREVGLPGQAFQ